MAKLTPLKKHLGPLAYDVLVRHGARVDAEAKGEASALRSLLKKHEYTPHDAVIDFEALFGGLVVPDEASDEPDFDMAWTFGAFSCVSSGAHSDPRGGDVGVEHALVPIAYSPNDIIFYLDANGGAWAEDTIEGPDTEPYAKSGACMLARILLGMDVFDRRFAGSVIQLDARRGAEIAKELGLAEIPEATDDLARWWGDATTLVFERAAVTTIASADEERIARFAPPKA